MQPIYQQQDSRVQSGKHQPILDAAATAHAHEFRTLTPSIQAPETFLQPAEVRSLTGRIRRSAQVKVLRSMGIEHKVRPDGGIAVLRAHINKVFDGTTETTPRRHQKVASPNWLAI